MNLGTMPDRIARLPRDHRGYPVPFFVAWVDGKPVFPRADTEKLARAVRSASMPPCWVCGEPLGKFRSFVIGPMCTINRVSSEPPCHRECATFSALVCPFLANPNMRRVPSTDEQRAAAPGIMLERNPGVCCVWTVRSTVQVLGYRMNRVPGGVLFRLGDPDAVEWYAKGRQATREEVTAAMESGFPALRDMAEAQDGSPSGEACQMLGRMLLAALRHLPVEVGAA